MVTKETCSHRIFKDFSSQRCSKKVVDGTVFCKIHNPEYIREKVRKQNEEWEKSWAIRQRLDAERIANRKLAEVAVASCKAVNESNPFAVAQNIKGLVTALTTIATCQEKNPGDVVDIAKQAIANVMEARDETGR